MKTYEHQIKYMKQKIVELDANERERVGGERKMHRIPTGLNLSFRLIKELTWKG